MDTNQKTYQFIAGWLLMILILKMITRSRLGYVLVYYALLLMILFVVVTEYARLAPLIGGIQTIGELNQ